MSKKRLASLTLRPAKSRKDQLDCLHEAREDPGKPMTHEAPVTPQNWAMFSSISLFLDNFNLLDLD